MSLPSLKFSSLISGPRETPPDLIRWLYKGGAVTKPYELAQSIVEGILGELLMERVELVVAIHQIIDSKLAGGGSQTTAHNQIKEINRFFIWVDEVDASLFIDNISENYIRWTELLLYRCNVKKEISEGAVYDSASKVGNIFDSVLGRQKPILHLTRVTKPGAKRKSQGQILETQNLRETFEFGHLLQDICDGLSLEVIWGGFVAQIQRKNGGLLKLWTGGSTSKRKTEWARWEVRSAEERARKYIEHRSLTHRGRKSLVNMRILAELLMFIGQTGMNLGQAFQLKLCNFSYSSDIEGYKVRDYKHRRAGEVLFEIFSEYRPHFERYLAWRRELFPNSSMLFPVIREGSLSTRRPLFDLLISLCKRAGVTWIPPSTLRGTRVNWLLQRSGDPNLTAELAQHSKETLLSSYNKVSQHRANSEITRFWTIGDPELKKIELRNSVAPGACDGEPYASPYKPATSPEPDCTVPSGCLWCEHHRDIDTQDYVWELSSFRYLKLIELSNQGPISGSQKNNSPAKQTVNTLSDKLNWFRSSNSTRRKWVENSLAHIDEGRYHPNWEYIIRDLQGY